MDYFIMSILMDKVSRNEKTWREIKSKLLGAIYTWYAYARPLEVQINKNESK